MKMLSAAKPNTLLKPHGPSMEASILRFSLISLSLFTSTGATFHTPNFIVTAPTADVAEQIGKAAEEYRRELAVFWLNQPLPNWSRPCKLKVRPGSIGAGGETKFQFVGNEVLNWDMYVQGSVERILDSVLPHEVNHTIFACHFRRPLPRWADEGAATLFEHRSEQMKQLGLLNQVIESDREFIQLPRLLEMKEYPKGYRPMLIMYAEGYALADFLVQQGGRKRYLKFLADGERMGWTKAIKENYSHAGVDSLQKNWKGWILAGMPKLNLPKGQMFASTDRQQDASRPTILDEYQSQATVRSQSPDDPRESNKRSRVTQQHNPTSSARNARPSASQETREQPEIVSALTMHRQQEASDRIRFRAASFEAPRPQLRSATGSGFRTQLPQLQNSIGRRTAQPAENSPTRSEQASGNSRIGFESTALERRLNEQDLFHRRHLPQERNVVTGSTPQWAGFPGQSESF